MAEIKGELFKRKKGMRLGSDYRLCLRPEDGEEWKETYESNDTLVVQTLLRGPVIHADPIEMVEIVVKPLTGKSIERQAVPSLHTATQYS